MFLNNSLLPWKIQADTAALSAVQRNASKMVQHRAEIQELLKQNKEILRKTEATAERITRLSETIPSGSSVENTILAFAFDGESRKFDVNSISNPSAFSNEFHFDIAFLQELVPVCLKSLSYITSKNDFSKNALKRHNMRLSSELQTFISYHRTPLDIASFSVSLEKNKNTLTPAFVQIANTLISDANYSLKKVSFESNMYSRFNYLSNIDNIFSYADTPNNYLFAQNLAVQLGVDTQCKQIPTNDLPAYLLSLCPIKSNFQKFDFLRYLFVQEATLSAPEHLRHIAVFSNLDSLNVDAHGILNTLTREEKESKSPTSLYEFK